MFSKKTAELSEQEALTKLILRVCMFFLNIKKGVTEHLLLKI